MVKQQHKILAYMYFSQQLKPEKVKVLVEEVGVERSHLGENPIHASPPKVLTVCL